MIFRWIRDSKHPQQDEEKVTDGDFCVPRVNSQFDAAGVLPPGWIKVTLHKVIKRPHVFFFRKQNVIGDALQNLKEKTQINKHIKNKCNSYIIIWQQNAWKGMLNCWHYIIPQAARLEVLMMSYFCHPSTSCVSWDTLRAITTCTTTWYIKIWPSSQSNLWEVPHRRMGWNLFRLSQQTDN